MLLIKGGRVIDPASGRDEVGHLMLENGKVREFLAREAPARFQGEVIPAEGKWVVPGLIDTLPQDEIPHPQGVRSQEDYLLDRRQV